MRLGRAQEEIMAAMAGGELLRSHRDLSGAKSFRLHRTGGEWHPVKAKAVRSLRMAGMIDSNKKFPVATFWLTQAGRDYLDQDRSTPT